MSYKIVFSDIDGTLLNHERELSPLTLDVFRQLNESVPVVLISSRMPQAMHHLQEQLEIRHQPLICYNGGLVLIDGEVTSSTEIPLPILESLLDFNINLDCHLSLFHNTEWYVPEMDFWASREENNTKVTPEVASPEEVLRRWRKQSKSAHKIMAMGEEALVDRIAEFLQENHGEHLHLYRSKSSYLEIANKQVSKLTAIGHLLQEHFHLQLEEAIAFGDNYNDYEMLKAVGMGIAVGNAKPEILEIAKEITYRGKEDGVARSLQQLFGLEKS